MEMKNSSNSDTIANANSEQSDIQSMCMQQFRTFWAPGRVNLIGEHTDYNQGYVLPVAINLGTVIDVIPGEERIIRVQSNNFNETIEIDLDKPPKIEKGSWINYIEGVARILDEGFKVWNRQLSGANLIVEGNVPIGSGLSSSASLEIATALALMTTSGIAVDPVTTAFIGQKAEHDYVGTKCGIMDQLISVMGKKDHALLIDTLTLDFEHVPLNFENISIVVCNTEVKHTLSTSAYNTRKEECEQAVKLLNEIIPLKNATSLRDISLDEFNHFGNKLPEHIRKRCKHVLTENYRTLAMAEALRRRDLDKLRGLMLESHNSLRDDYEVSCEELDKMVEIALKIDGVIGCRMTGGGFGGCTVNIVRDDALANFTTTIKKEYKDATGIEPGIYVLQTSDGAEDIT